MAQCHHGLCSDIVYRPLQNIKLDRHLVPTGIFFQFSDDVRELYAGKLPTKSQWKAIVDNFCRAGTYRLFYVENVLRVTQTRVIYIPAVL